MNRSLSLEAEFLPTDRFTIDGEAFRFLGTSSRGYLFVGQDRDDNIREVLDTELLDLVCDPGRFSLESEFFKKRSKGK